MAANVVVLSAEMRVSTVCWKAVLTVLYEVGQ